jgi:type I restriction enzyme S subunit
MDQTKLVGFAEEATEEVRLKYLANINPSKSEISHLPSETPVSFVSLSNFGTDGEIKKDEVRPLEEVYDGYTYFREGDIAIAKITPSFENEKGAICADLENGIGFGTTELHVIRTSSEIHTRYLWYALRTKPFMDRGEAAMKGVAGQQRVPKEFVGNFEVPHYPIKKQRAIADFLDERTNKINQLLEKNQCLIDLLEEKRDAEISKAVAKGISPDVDMMDSGVDWVGKIPSHWEKYRIGSLIEEVKNPVDVQEDEIYQEIGIRSYGKGIFYKDPVTGEQIGSKNVFHVVKNALVFNIVFAWEGAVAVSSEDESGMIASHRFPMYVPRNDNINLNYLKYFFTHGYGSGVLDWNSHGAAGRNRTLNREAMLSEEFWIPPRDEQDEIVHYLSEMLDDIDKLAESLRKEIELLREKRRSLITKAVMGEIDLSERYSSGKQESNP